MVIEEKVKQSSEFSEDNLPFGVPSITKESAQKLFKDAAIEIDDPDSATIQHWQNLAMHLADRYHPDFKGPVGNRRHMQSVYYAILYGIVKFIQEDKDLPTDKSALQYLSYNFPNLFIDARPAGNSPTLSTLETDLVRARKYIKDGKVRI